MRNFSLIFLGKSIGLVSKALNLGSGSTWPGHIALSLNKHIISDLLKNSKTKIVLIAGTNGKTTTGKMIATILAYAGKDVFQNNSGANLMNGLASTLIANADLFGAVKNDYLVFECDENSLPVILKEVTPHAVVFLNLFRDQLDRYGEIDSIIKKWKESLADLPKTTTVYLNADDPQIADLGKNLNANVLYFGLGEKNARDSLQHASDSIYCPNCHTKLAYQKIYYSHLGVWSCPKCKFKRPKPDITSADYPLSGTYNKYNTLASVLFAQHENISFDTIGSALQKVTPAFGRQEIIEVNGKNAQIFLAKNPASFNQTLQTITELGAKTVLVVLNDNVPDGRDVSWIWDVDFEEYVDTFTRIFISGERVYDMALRIQYTQKLQNHNEKVFIYENPEEAMKVSLLLLSENETLYILPTYSAMLDVRKILTGKKIL